MELFTQVKMDLGLPVALFGDVVLNTEADDEDLGWLVGAELGKAKDPGSYSLGYDYRNLEANAVVGAFTDSDSGGGGTDISGHRVKGKYQIAKNYQTALTLFFQETGISGDEEDYTWHFDTTVYVARRSKSQYAPDTTSQVGAKQPRQEVKAR